MPVVCLFVNPQVCLLWLNSLKMKVMSGYQNVHRRNYRKDCEMAKREGNNSRGALYSVSKRYISVFSKL